MKRIGFILLLLAMVFAGCNNGNNILKKEQKNGNPEKSKIEDNKNDFVKSDTLAENSTIDSSAINMFNFPILGNPQFSSNNLKLNRPWKQDTVLGINIFSDYEYWKNTMKPITDLNSDSFGNNSLVVRDKSSMQNK